MGFPPSVIQLIVWCLIAGVLLWAMNRIPQIDADLKNVVKIVVVVVLVIKAIYVVVGLVG